MNGNGNAGNAGNAGNGNAAARDGLSQLAELTGSEVDLIPSSSSHCSRGPVL